MLSVAVAQQLHPPPTLFLLSTYGTLPGRHRCTFQLFSKSVEQLLRRPIQMSHPNIKWVEKRPQWVVVSVILTDNIWHLANANDPNVLTLFATNLEQWIPFPRFNNMTTTMVATLVRQHPVSSCWTAGVLLSDCPRSVQIDALPGGFSQIGGEMMISSTTLITFTASR